MIEWIAYESRLPESHVLYLVSGGLWISFGIHQLDTTDRVYRWFGTDGEAITDVTHFAKINYPFKLMPTKYGNTWELDNLLEPIKLASMSRRELINVIRNLEHENSLYKKALEEIKDEEWRLAGEFTTIYMTAYSALFQDDDERGASLP